jgi:fused signal recognition particle receptor
VRVLVRGLNHESLEELEERLIAADFGVAATLRLTDHLEAEMRRRGTRDGTDLRAALRGELAAILAPRAGDGALVAADTGVTVYLVVGVNGVGKTTSVAKLAHALVREGKRVTVAAADTYRAGAVDQLRQWAERAGADFVAGQAGGDPAAVAFDALEAAISRDSDVVIVDTAGRLHTDRNLMEELEKVGRVIAKKIPGAPHETLLVVDATTGQNALRQASEFAERVPLTGIVLAKADGSARGGIVVALRQELDLAVRLVGTGEGLADLEAFDVEAFLDDVFEDDAFEDDAFEDDAFEDGAA